MAQAGFNLGDVVECVGGHVGIVVVGLGYLAVVPPGSSLGNGTS